MTQNKNTNFCNMNKKTIRNRSYQHYILFISLLLSIYCFSLIAGEEDYYRILGVDKKATEKELKKAWRRVSLELHPDKNKAEDAAEKFAEASIAYDVLSDPEKREIYDNYGHEGIKKHEQGQGQGGGGMDPFSSMFEAFGFGGFGRRRGNEERRSDSVVIPLSLTLKQLYLGEMVDFTYVRQVMCLNHKECMSKCPDCHGPGVRIKQQQLAPGFVQQVQQRDDKCVARGKCWKPRCKACPNGQTEPEKIELNLEIQPGMYDEEQITFEQVADEVVGATAGDLVFVIRQVQHHQFVRRGDDLYVNMRVDLKRALIGFDTTITHLDGREVIIHKPDVTYPGEIQVVKREGMPRRRRRGAFGDLIITWEIEFPDSLNQSQKDYIEKALNF